VVDDQLGAPVEQLCQRLCSLVGVEAVLLFDRQPRQVAPLGGELVAAAGIIAAIIDTHTAAKNANEPSRVWAPMSIPVICRTATTQDAAASPSAAVSAAAVAAVLAPVTAAEREAGVASVPHLDRTAGSATAPMSQLQKPATRSLAQPAEAPSASMVILLVVP